ncbi:MAG: site-specific integrase [Steroidobacteraceae bacterium]
MRPRHATFPAKRDAERWAAKREGEWARHRHFPDEESSRRTLTEAIDRWIREELPSKRSAKTIKGHLQWWKRRIGAKTLAQVTPAVLSEIKSELAAGTFARATPGSKHTSLKKGEKAKQFRRSAATVNRYLQALGSVLTYCEREWSWLQESPLKRIRKLKQAQGRVRYLTDAERTKLLEACATVDPQLHTFVILALSTGARAGELRELRWKDVDLKRGRAVLNRTKNDDRRALTLAGAALELMKDQRHRRRLDSDRVFPQAGSDRPYDYHKPFRLAVDAVGIADFRFHDLRHTAASWLAMTGATGPEIAAVLGHRTLAMVKRYSHLGEQHVAGVVERMVAAKLGN